MIYSDSKYQVVKRQRLQIDHLKIASEISISSCSETNETNEAPLSTSSSVETMKIYLFKAVVSRGSGCDGDSLGAGHEVVLKYG